MRDQAEAVADGGRRSDAPACRRGAGFQNFRRTQQKERHAGIGGGELQSLAQSQIELVDHAGDGGDRARMQRFLQRPQSLFAMRGPDQDQAAWIEAERTDAVAVRTAVIAQPVSRKNEDDFFPPPEGRVREGGTRCGNDDPPPDRANASTSPSGGRWKTRRASNAVMKPKAAAVERSPGTISCKAPPGSPPCGRQ